MLYNFVLKSYILQLNGKVPKFMGVILCFKHRAVVNLSY